MALTPRKLQPSLVGAPGQRRSPHSQHCLTQKVHSLPGPWTLRSGSTREDTQGPGCWDPETATVPVLQELTCQAGSEASPAPSLSTEEQRALERKLKKERKKEEKRRLREAGSCPARKTPAPRIPTDPTPPSSGATLALDYLCGWAQKRQDWKFQKTRQTWLLVHMYNPDKVPDEHFPTLLAYLEGLKGQARELTVQKAEAQMQALGEGATDGQDSLLLGQAHRLRQVLQLLS
ncbi:PREDICTED: uncharacterized protein C7orf50 homolog [Elephantulus edwardii]|uniref:uncharacterized protein C7orf50 homolog n=1 Tax=Elephantulus edwardii TaxID=28737 RepID=UPI0003F07C6A|nr:PREDICTED: uncharacterized protein C7orf50 homolog [Elephantulus edwardii]